MKGELELNEVFPGLSCDMLFVVASIGSDGLLQTDKFGLQAFDSKKPLTRMLPGSSPCELRLMLGTDGFHDVLVDNLSASPSWRSGHISPADVRPCSKHYRNGRRKWSVRVGCMPDDDKFGHSVPVCALATGYGVENAGKEPRSQ